MRILGIDYGDVRIGLAVSDDLGITAQGIEVLRRTSFDKDMDHIARIVNDRGIECIVVGWPRNMDGSRGPRAALSEEFADQLRQILHLPVELWDERLSTVSAERLLINADVSRKKRKNVVDKMAAALILQNYMDTMRARETRYDG